MRIIEIVAQDNGAHRNQEGVFNIIPEGWAVIPFTMEVPETFPFVNIEVEGNVVTKMTAGVMPEPEPVPEPEPESGGEYATYDELAAAIKEGVNSV